MHKLNIDLESKLKINNHFDSELYINTLFKEIFIMKLHIKNEKLYLNIDKNSMLYEYKFIIKWFKLFN